MVKKPINNNDNTKDRKLGKDQSLDADALVCIGVEYMADANGQLVFPFFFFLFTPFEECNGIVANKVHERLLPHYKVGRH